MAKQGLAWFFGLVTVDNVAQHPIILTEDSERFSSCFDYMQFAEDDRLSLNTCSFIRVSTINEFT